MNLLEAYAAKEGIGRKGTASEAHEDGRACILHLDVRDEYAAHAASVDNLECDARGGALVEWSGGLVVDDGVAEDDIFDAAVGGCADLEAVAAGREHAVGDSDIFCGEQLAVWVLTLDADGVITGRDIAVGDEDILASGDVHAVCVGRVDGILEMRDNTLMEKAANSIVAGKGNTVEGTSVPGDRVVTLVNGIVRYQILDAVPLLVLDPRVSRPSCAAS